MTDPAGSEVEEEVLERALMACDFPLVVWSLIDAPTVRLANQAAARLFGTSLSELPGRRGADVADPPLAVQETFALMASGAIEAAHTDRAVVRPDGSTVPVRVWTRVIALQHSRVAVSLVVPISEMARLGRDPATPWRDLAQIAVGTARTDWEITQISRDVAGLLGRAPSDLIGTSLLDLVDPAGADALLRAASQAGGSLVALPDVAFRHRDGTAPSMCFLVATDRNEADEYYFALVGYPVPGEGTADRVTELEMRLRRIGAEVRASGVLDGIRVLASRRDAPELAELTARQWEILSRLMDGERVPTIASELYLSQSTVRNHLATIFRRFGVHSQAELLAALRRRQDEALKT